MEPLVIGLIVVCTMFAALGVQAVLGIAFDSGTKGKINLSAETPRQKELKVLYDLGFLCGKHDGWHSDYGRPCHIAPDLDRLHWWNGYHDGLKWREEEKKLNGNFQ